MEWPTESEDSSAGAWQIRRYSGSSSNLLESHINTLEPQPGEQQHYHHVGEGKSKPRGEVHGIFAVRKQSEGRNTGPHLYQTLSRGPHETVWSRDLLFLRPSHPSPPPGNIPNQVGGPQHTATHKTSLRSDQLTLLGVQTLLEISCKSWPFPPEKYTIIHT